MRCNTKYLTSITQLVVEKLFWATGILLSLLAIGTLSKSFTDYTRENPIATSIRLIPIESVPFPAIIVDPGEADRMAVLKKSRSMVTEQDFNNQCNASDVFFNLRNSQPIGCGKCIDCLIKLLIL